MALVRAISGAAPRIRVYAVAGEQALSRAEDLALHPAIQRVASPRQATLLVVCGHVPGEHHEALRRLHDQIPHPRALVTWADDTAPDLPFDAVTIASGETDDAVDALRRTQSALRSGERPSSRDLLPDVPPAPWRGLGDHGQGGEGMMGGKPYGRPMAMPDDDLRDGLALGAYSMVVGPFAPMLPPGMLLEVTLQGDVIQTAALRRRPFPDRVELYRGRALRCLSRLLRVRGQAALADRLQRAGRRRELGQPVDVDSLRRLLRWSGLFAGIEPGLGELSGARGKSRSGASSERARSYGRNTGADVRGRVRAWLAQASADDEPLPGPVLADEALGRLLQGLEWGQAVTVLASFDVDALCTAPGGSSA